MLRTVPILLLLLVAAMPARAQLLSPGPLFRSHVDLEGIRNCTQCHAIGRRGIDSNKCLSCHTPIRTRITQDRGLHANVSQECATCHNDHQGRSFNPSAFTTSRFDHRLADYNLVGQHIETACRDCHTSANITDREVRRIVGGAGRLNDTYLGLGNQCESCHARETPHTRALANKKCESCHSPTGWDDTPQFSHRDTGFILTGGHVTAACSGCHKGTGEAQFRNIPRACESCHQTDSPHGRQFSGQSCQTCHSTTNWTSAPNFNHSRTSFPLTGSHARVSCTSCHAGGQFEGVTARCATCHADDNAHGSQFAGQECGSCHGPSRWTGAELFNHDRSAFRLAGKHIGVACTDCHDSAGRSLQFKPVEFGTCQSCHEDTHDGSLGADCQTCHTPSGWDRMATSFDAERFDHEQHTGYPLVGAHLGAECAACHGSGGRSNGFARRDADYQIRLAGAAGGETFPKIVADSDVGACLSCHTDAHEGNLADLPQGAACDSCHGQDAWTPATFDLVRHASTKFELTGAHMAVPCTACHGTAARPDFSVVGACQSCHGDDSPHGRQFDAADGVAPCADCHATSSWSAAEFDHGTRTDFELAGAHAVTDCASCHTKPADPTADWLFTGLESTCTSCHSADDPHQGQFEGRACDTCHDAAAFTMSSFDHESTAFPLAGAHASVSCSSCHVAEAARSGETFIRFRPLPTDCASCHTGSDG